MATCPRCLKEFPRESVFSGSYVAGVRTEPDHMAFLHLCPECQRSFDELCAGWYTKADISDPEEMPCPRCSERFPKEDLFSCKYKAGVRTGGTELTVLHLCPKCRVMFDKFAGEWYVDGLPCGSDELPEPLRKLLPEDPKKGTKAGKP